MWRPLQITIQMENRSSLILQTLLNGIFVGKDAK